MASQSVYDFALQKAREMYRRGFKDGRMEVLHFALDACLEMKFGAAGADYVTELFAAPREELWTMLSIIPKVETLEDLRDWWSRIEYALDNPHGKRNPQ